MTLLTSFLYWLDALPPRYWFGVWFTVGLVCFSVLAVWVAPQTGRRWNHPAVFFAAVALAIFAFRWPLIFANAELFNPDESYMLAGALASMHDPIPWRAFDGMTHGPVNVWPLASMGAAGVRLDYTNARLVAALFVWLTVIFTWATLRHHFGERLARLLVLPLAIFVIFTKFGDFVQYSSEHVPMVLLAAATWLLCTSLLPLRANAFARLTFAGLLLGLVPFAKLQGVPPALWLGGIGLLFLLTSTAAPFPTRLKLATCLISGAVFAPVLILGIAALTGGWKDFWVGYIQANLFYATTFPVQWGSIGNFVGRLAEAAENYLYFLRAQVITVLTAVVLRLFWARTADWKLVVLSVGLLLSAFYAVVAPGRTFTHYLHFTFAPLVLTSGALFGSVLARTEGPEWRWRSFRLRPLALLLALVFVAVTIWPIPRFPFDGPHIGRFCDTKGKLLRSEVAKLVLTLTDPSEPIIVWGWRPGLYVECGRHPGVREAETEREIFAGPVQDFFRERFLRDFERSNAPVFVDAVAPNAFFFADRSLYAHETFPELQKLIAERYRLIAEIRGTRVYLRHDRPFDPPDLL